MVEGKVSIYDDASATSSLTSADYMKSKSKIPTAETDVFEEKGTPNNEDDEDKTNKSTSDTVPAAASDADRVSVVVAGVGSAVVGLLICGPILAVLFGCGAAYAAETNAEIRHKVGTVWAQAKRINQEHSIVERSVNTVGKGVCWIVQKISAGLKCENADDKKAKGKTPVVY